jgi:EPS-associated MarR family transcriptional regulator
MANLHDELRYKFLKILQAEPEISQRELANRLGISLGKANYCVKALMECGWVKVRNFKNSENKRAYAYYLTKRGLAEKTRVTVAFVKAKMVEFEALRSEIDSLYSANMLEEAEL